MLLRFLSIVATAFTLAAPLSAAPIPEETFQNGFAVGCQAYSFNRFSLFEAIEKTAEAGGKIIEFYPGQKISKLDPATTWSHHISDDVLSQIQAKLKEHSVTVVNYGVVSASDATEWRKVFEFGKRLGLYGITTEQTEHVDILEPLVKEFDIALCFHNHPRKLDDPNYKVWDPHYIAEVTKDRDPRIGACADTGHWQTSGINPVYALRVLKGRVLSSHLKDKRDYGSSFNVVYGTGVGEIGRCLDELKKQNFKGNLSIEHEYNWMKSVPDITRCVEFVVNHKSPPVEAETTETVSE